MALIHFPHLQKNPHNQDPDPHDNTERSLDDLSFQTIAFQAPTTKVGGTPFGGGMRRRRGAGGHGLQRTGNF